MAIDHSTAPARAGERARTPYANLYAREAPFLAPDELGASDIWEAARPLRPDTPHVRARLFLNATGELLVCIAIVAGGMVLTGLATLV